MESKACPLWGQRVLGGLRVGQAPLANEGLRAPRASEGCKGFRESVARLGQAARLAPRDGMALMESRESKVREAILARQEPIRRSKAQQVLLGNLIQDLQEFEGFKAFLVTQDLQAFKGSRAFLASLIRVLQEFKAFLASLIRVLQAFKGFRAFLASLIQVLQAFKGFKAFLDNLSLDPQVHKGFKAFLGNLSLDPQGRKASTA